jgi:hypothetical protein
MHASEICRKMRSKSKNLASARDGPACKLFPDDTGTYRRDSCGYEKIKSRPTGPPPLMAPIVSLVSTLYLRIVRTCRHSTHIWTFRLWVSLVQYSTTTTVEASCRTNFTYAGDSPIDHPARRSKNLFHHKQ